MLELVGTFLNGTPWAITPKMFQEMRRIYDDARSGKLPDIAAIEAQIGKPLTNEQRPYEVVDGVAIISASGVIAKKMNLFQQISGGISTEKLTADFKNALSDPSVNAIVLVLDSPGGSVDGIFELTDLIYSARDVKTILSVAYGTAASAAYLLASAASQIYASDVATIVGSIGVVATHKDTSEKDNKDGLVTEIYRGKYKRIVTSGPLTEEGRQSMEEKVDYFYSLFIDAVARNRGVTAETVLNAMSTDVADYFIGKQAVDAGLIDGIASLDQVIAQAATLSSDGVYQGNSTLIKFTKEEHGMANEKILTKAELRAAYTNNAFAFN